LGFAKIIGSAEFSSVIPYKSAAGEAPHAPESDSFSHRKIASVSPATIAATGQTAPKPMNLN